VIIANKGQRSGERPSSLCRKGSTGTKIRRVSESDSSLSPSLPESDTFWSFLKAIKNHWITLMSGGAITVAVALYERWSRQNIPTWIYVSILIFFLFCACYLAWRDEQRRRMKAEQHLTEERESKQSKFSASIHQVFSGDMPQPSGRTAVGLIMLVEVKNTGAESAAEGWTLHLQSKDFELTVKPSMIEDVCPLYDGNGNVIATLRGQEALYEKAMTPIRRGVPVRGWLRYHVPDLTAAQIRRPGVVATISFQDMLGEVPYTSEPYYFSGKFTPPNYLPGTDQPFSGFAKNS